MEGKRANEMVDDADDCEDDEQEENEDGEVTGGQAMEPLPGDGDNNEDEYEDDTRQSEGEGGGFDGNEKADETEDAVAAANDWVEGQPDDLNPESNPHELRAFAGYDWENEVARNILTLFASSVKANPDGTGQLFGDAVDGDGAAVGAADGEAMEAAVAPSQTADATGDEQAPTTDRSESKSDTGNHRKRGKKKRAAKKGGRRGSKPTTPSQAVPAQQGRLRSSAAPPADKKSSMTKRTVTIKSKDGKDIEIIVPAKKAPVWFTGTGSVPGEWSALHGGDQLNRALEEYETSGQYTRYIATAESLIHVRLRNDGPDEICMALWRQLVACCLAFAVRGIEQKDFDTARSLLLKAETLTQNETLLTQRVIKELRAFHADTQAFFFFRKGKPRACVDLLKKAMRTHTQFRQWAHVAKVLLHQAAVESAMKNHTGAVETLNRILQMVGEGQLDIDGASPQKLCMVAITYLNIATEYLNQREFEKACLASQNARRLARLCLSYSNRWLPYFERTHRTALAEVEKQHSAAMNMSGAQARFFSTLTDKMFDPNPFSGEETSATGSSQMRQQQRR